MGRSELSPDIQLSVLEQVCAAGSACFQEEHAAPARQGQTQMEAGGVPGDVHPVSIRSEHRSTAG